MTETLERAAIVLTLADGEAREAKTFPLGDYSCPFCSAAVISPAGWLEHERLNAECYAKMGETYQAEPYRMGEVYERRGCPNPCCFVNMSAAQLAETRARIASREAEAARRKRDHEAAMDAIRESREADNRLWAELAAKAETAGQCVRCLRRSYWRSSPRFVKHRDEANCPNAHR